MESGSIEPYFKVKVYVKIMFYVSKEVTIVNADNLLLNTSYHLFFFKKKFRL